MLKYIKNRFSHWTPRYIYNRLRLIRREFLNPNDPWFTGDAIFIINQLLKSSDVGLEFGSGRSTLWLAKRVRKLISIEHNEFWFNKIKKKIEEENIKNVDYLFKKENEYLDVLNEINENSLDFVLADGLVRDVCAKKVIPKLRNSGLLITDSRIKLLGFIQPKDLSDLYAENDVFILPSIYDGWGIVVNEAMAAAMPIVATNKVGAVIEFIKHKENGFICNTDINSIKEGLWFYLKKKNLIYQHGQKNRKIIKKSYGDVQNAAQYFIEIIKNL